MAADRQILRLHTLEALRAWRTKSTGSVGFVPTMGNLHQGHLTLVEQALKRCDQVIVSIFVNPLQFGPNEDFDRYPRTLDADCVKLSAVSQKIVVYAPDVADMYPDGGASKTTVSVAGVSAPLCGASRPGHFDGVATVVCKLLQRVQADAAFFGSKDFQQLAVIRQMVQDLDVPVEIVAVETVRESDGLALSSRNQYLSASEREIAPKLYRCLSDIAQLLRHCSDWNIALAEYVEKLQVAGFDVEYLQVLDAENLGPPSRTTTAVVCALAARLGSTRLIDNIVVKKSQ